MVRAVRSINSITEELKMSEKHSGVAVEEREVSLGDMDQLRDLDAVSSEEGLDLAEAQGNEKF